MAYPTYLDFDLHIEPEVTPPSTQPAYRVRLLASPAGEAQRLFSLPASQADLDRFVAQQPIPQPSAGESPIAAGDPQALGAALFAALFDGELLAAWRSSLTIAASQEKGLRLRLRLADAPGLAALPWEFLHDAAQDKAIVLSTKTPIVRYLDLSKPVEALALDPPLSILAVVSSPADYPALNAEQEWANLQTGVADLVSQGKVVLTRLERADLTIMQGEFRRHNYHIIHYIGHGGFDPESGKGVLILEDSQGNAQLVPADHLGTLLEDHGSLRLVVLNSCEGGRSAPGSAFAGAAQTLVKRGIPGVIAMQFEITDQAAITFSRELYAALADLYPVDAAVTEARKAIYLQNNDREWATPVLYLRTPDARLFRTDAHESPPAAHPADSGQAAASPARQSKDVAVSVTINDSTFAGGGPISIGTVGGGLAAPSAPPPTGPAPGTDSPTAAELGALPGMEADIRTHLKRLIQLEDKVLFAETAADESRWQAKADVQRQALIDRISAYQAELVDFPAYTPPTDIQAAKRHLGHNE